MAQKNRANMLTDIVTNIFNNIINYITGQNAQDRFVNLLDSTPNILSDANQASGYPATDINNEIVSTYYNENDSRANIITMMGLGELVGSKFYQVNDADGGTRTLQVCAENALILHNFAIDVQTGETGDYDINTDVFTPIVVSGTPTLQQVLDVGNTSTTSLSIDDGVGSSVNVKSSSIDIYNTLGGQASIQSQSLTTATTFEIPNKAAGIETFAMLSDITGGGTVTSVNSGTNISVDNTDPANPIINSLADRYSTSSVTSNTVSNGSKTFTVDADLAYIPLQEVLIVYDPSNHMHSTVTSYSGTTLVVNVKSHTGSGTYTSWVLNLDGVPVDAITGVGTVNEISYFTAGQVIASLAVATYPSLTELAYVKGVTSAIQTQLNTKVTAFASATDGTASSGTTNTISISVLIPANTFALDDVIRINHRVRVSGIAATRETRVYVNTSASLTGAIVVSLATLTSTTLAANLQRFLAIKNATTNTEVVSVTTSLLTDYNNVPSTASVTTLAINWTVDQYIIFAVNATNGADSIRATMYSIEKL